uniref:HNH endonuclease n=1 Tax=viral metagenome TaxID=1070528 RepID=A0A6C0JYP9_9ZZZZ
MEDEKKITIQGTSNRYQINKLKKEEKVVKIRKTAEKMSLPEDYYLLENQQSIVKDLQEKTYIFLKQDNCPQVLNQIDKKLASYKQQDILKKRYNESLFIKTDDTIKLLNKSNMLCHYCREKTFLLYDIVREMNQWTLDRIDNDMGHNSGNLVISCLACNLKRRRTGKDAFLFTKQLNIVKS